MVETGGAGNTEQFCPSAARHPRKPPRHVERYWLCDRCAAEWTLMQDRSGGIALAPLSRAPVGSTVAVQGYRRDL
jgi:hypothetical protein